MLNIKDRILTWVFRCAGEFDIKILPDLPREGGVCYAVKRYNDDDFGYVYEEKSETDGAETLIEITLLIANPAVYFREVTEQYLREFPRTEFIDLE